MKKRVWESMKSVYDLFVRRVAEGRGLKVEQVGRFAEGRLFAASQGLELGMVDELGGLDRAIAYAKRAGGLEADAPVEVLTGKSELLETLGLDDDQATERRMMTTQRKLLLEVARETVGPRLVDYTLSLAPMMNEERALVSVLFALIVR
jgi:protease-4